VILKNNEVIAGISSGLVYQGAVEVEVATRPNEQGNGFAKKLGATMILESLNRDTFPLWDAHNVASKKVAEFLKEEGYNVSAEDILIGQFVPSFLQNFITFVPKYVFLAYNDKEFFVIGTNVWKGTPDKNKLRSYSLNEVDIKLKNALLNGKLVLTFNDGKKEKYRIFKLNFASFASRNFKKALEHFDR